MSSTVKKLNPTKSRILEKHHKIINEHSMIGELDCEPTNKKTEDICVGIFYYLKDGTKVEKKLIDLNTIDLDEIHESCSDDVKDIQEIYVSVQRTH
jgi:hypothetical protein